VGGKEKGEPKTPKREKEGVNGKKRNVVKEGGI